MSLSSQALERRTYIVFSVCLGSHASRQRIYTLYLVHCIEHSLFKYEEYTLHLELLCSHTLCSLQIAHQSTVYFSTGTNGANRQVVSARLPAVNMCSLQMEHRSAASFSIGTIGSNGRIMYHWIKSTNSLCTALRC